MKGKIAIVTIVVLLFATIPFVVNIGSADQNLTLSDAELATQFAKASWPEVTGTVIITDILGTGVQFDFAGVSAKSAVYDNYPVSQLAGGAMDITGGYGNFTACTHYRVLFRNNGTSGVNVNIFMNTGFTTSPYGVPAEDTYWECSWNWINAGETKIVTLNFSAAIVYGAYDDTNPAWQYAQGSVHPIHRLDEVTAIGFQVLVSGSASLILSQPTKLYVDPYLTEKQAIDIDSFFNVTFKLEGFTDLAGFDLNITWNDALITFGTAYYLVYLSGIWASYTVPKHENGTRPDGTGYYKFVAVSLSGGHSSIASKVLLTLTFKVMNPLTNSMKETLLHFDTHKLSDSASNSIEHVAEDGTYRMWGQKPTLIMNPTIKICKTYSEAFSIGINISNAADVRDFEFEIHYNTTLLDYASITWNAWGTGAISVEEELGKISGSTNGGAVNGNEKLLTITFSATYYHIWKNLPSWQNDQSGTIYIQAANLSYPSPQPKLGYVRSGSPQEITVGTDATYTFSPIKGDINNDGDVDIFDLGDVAYYYDRSDVPAYNLIGAPVIDVFDLVLIASNYGFVYTP